MRFLLGGAALLCSTLALADIAGAQVAAPASTSSRGARTLQAIRASTPVTIDGKLDELDWTRATPADGFIQSEPRTGEPASEATEVRILFDGEFLYVGATLHDPDAGHIVLNDIRKDFKEEDQDDFEVLLDTFHDHRNGYLFVTNTAGARSDRQIANEGREINTSWDGVWSVKTQRTTDGWTVEMAIPFRTLRYQLGSVDGWGINFARRIRHRNELTYWAPIPRAFTISRVSLAGTLEGLAVDGTSRDLRLKPYAMGRTVRDVGGPSSVTSEAVGLDVTYGVTRHLAMNVTINPDFAQVEADEQQVNLTQFSQFFPEKREFFLENSGIFYVGDAARNNRVQLAPTPDEDMLLFFSRRIGLSPDGRAVPIPAGIRVSGTAGGLTIGALAMQTRRTATTPANQYNVLRLRRNLRPGSDIGLIVLDREAVGGGHAGNWNRVAGVDANFRLRGNWDWNNYAVGTRTPGREGGQYTWRTSVNHEDNFFHAKLGVLEVGRGFADDLGFFRRTDTRKYLADVGIRPRPSWLSTIATREMHPHFTWNYYETLDGRISAKDLHTGYTFFLSSGAYFELSGNPRFQRLATPFRINRDIAPIPAGGYAWTDWQFKGSTNASRKVSATYTFIEGGFWNGTQHTQQVLVSAKPSAKFAASVGASHTEAALTMPNATFEALLYTGRTNYSFTTNMFFDALAQYDPRSHQFNANLRFNLIHHPLSDLFIVLNEQKISLPDAPATGFGVIVKYTQMLAF
ncbi:MAG: carbohydrate binding family 9 domain-containing protein [Gemmatimonadaceae bacterium]|nr:carbohydrate binding family 9 domain-containing protein [Gemmatimonadaceae bacterium]